MSLVVSDQWINGPHGQLRVRVYGNSKNVDQSAGLVWVHGGAFSYGDLDMPEAHWVSSRIAEQGVPVVSVDYQLAGTGFTSGADVERRQGVTFPVASEEVGAAFEWAAGQSELGVAPSQWSLGGASAGANLAASATLRLRDQSGSRPHSLVLAYPHAHYELPPQRPELAARVSTLSDDARFSATAIEEMNLNYLGEAQRRFLPYAFPGGHDLQGLPPTFVLNSDFDDLRSSGEALASELAAAGVDVLMIREPGTRHGHLNDPDSPGAFRSIERMIAWLACDSLVDGSHDWVV